MVSKHQHRYKPWRMCGFCGNSSKAVICLAKANQRSAGVTFMLHFPSWTWTCWTCLAKKKSHAEPLDDDDDDDFGDGHGVVYYLCPPCWN
jgi:hypothetical protein